MPLRFPRTGRKTRVFLGLLVALAILVAVFDWNWFRHPAERYFINRSHREVSIGDLHIHLNANLEPTVRLRGLYIENAPWADNRPFVNAEEVSFTFSLQSIWQRRPVVSKLVLIDADVDLERQADGHRNWRLRNPENVERGRMKVMKLEAHDSRLRFVRRDVNLEVVAAAAPLEPASQNAGGALTTQILFEGSFQGTEFSGEAHTSDMITIMESETSFPIRGHMETGKTRLDFDGVVADLFRPAMMEGKVRLGGPSLAGLHPFVPGKLPGSRPYSIEAELRQKRDAISATSVRAKVGGTSLTGEASFDRGGARPMLKAALLSDSADLADLGSLAGLRERTREDPPPRVTTTANPDGESRKAKRLLSDKPISLAGLKALDAEVLLHLKKFKATAFPGLESLKVTAKLRGGVLSLDPFDLGIAEGNLVGSFVLDGRDQPATAAVKFDGRDIRIEQLLVGSKLAGHAAGPVFVHADLKGRGASIARLAGSASGSASLGMENGVVSKLADAVLELDLGKALRAVLSGNQSIAINKIDLAFDFDDGVGHARNIFIDTERSRILGTGKIDLRKEEFDLVLEPNPKKPGFFALDKAIQVSGTLRKPTISVVEKEEGPAPTSGIARTPAENSKR
jgi:uncharacterized protein involved in outer membrane biogenesis